MAQENRKWDDAVSRRRMRLIELLRQAAEGPKILAEALEALEELDRLHRGSNPSPDDATGHELQARGRRHRQSAAETGSRFLVEQTRRGFYLAERFSSNRQPFRCPEGAYNSTAAVMAKIKLPISFDELLADVRKASEDSLPDYLVRVCLRFWQCTDPPLVEKHRARYKPVRATHFVREARRAWEGLVGTE